jgi:citrate/tricarballylate utilization protein
MHAVDALAEADRLMTICNSCRYCEGLCPVFPAMEMRRAFTAGDLTYLANLCHSCGACYDDCQFAPPHEFEVNVPKTFARLRGDSYQASAWPGGLAGLFKHNGLAIALALAFGVAAFLGGIMMTTERPTLISAGVEPGAFYRFIPHGTLALIFAAALLCAIGAIAMSARTFWRQMGPLAVNPGRGASLRQAVRDAATLRFLDGGGAGCTNAGGWPTDRRKLFHHLTVSGFLLCAAATSVATLYHYLLGRQAPYPWYDLPVVLGTLGGAGLLIGPAGLLAARWQRDPTVIDEARAGMDVGFLGMLLLTSLTGLLLLILRGTPAMGVLLAIHLGVVLALFLALPYGKFVHGIYRFLALVRYARERHAPSRGAAKPKSTATPAGGGIGKAA